MRPIFYTSSEIPESYWNDFVASQTTLIKGRVLLLCILSIGLYFASTLISYFIDPITIRPDESRIWIAFTVSSVLVIFLNNKVKTLRSAKTIAFLFIAFLLALMTKVCMLYPEYAEHSSTLFLFILFLVCFTIPWTAGETAPIFLMHVLAYSLFYAYVHAYLPLYIKSQFNLEAYFDGVLLLSLAFVLCVVVRKNETAREVENFILLKEVEEKNIESRMLLKEVKKKNQQMQKELELATRVHKTLIPNSMTTDKVDVAVMYLPMYYIGGDYAKFHFLSKDKLIFIICDVTGHGVPAALLVNRVHSEFERLAQEHKEPGTLLSELNDFITKDFEGINMFLSAFCCTFDFKDMHVTYSNHGHPGQYLYRVRQSAIKRLDADSSLLGIPGISEKASRHSLEFGKGDKLLLFTDGVTETRDKKGVEFGKERLEDFINNNHGVKAEPFNQNLLEELNKFKSGDFEDDIFILTVDIK